MEQVVPLSGAGLLAIPSAVTSAAVWAPLRSERQVRALLGGVGVLARGAAGLELELARVLAWLHQQDAVELGHVTWGAFWGEHVDWGGSWLHEMIRLAECPLERVKRAAEEGILPLRVAVHAPGKVTVEQEEAWLAEAVLGPAPAETRDVDVFAGKEAETIRKARHLGRLLLGYAAPAREVDDYILRCWRSGVCSQQMVSDAKVPPPPPVPRAPLSWEGAPTSIRCAIERVEAVQAVLRGRTTVVAKAWARISHERLWQEAGYASQDDCAADVLGMSLRNAQRLAKVGWGLEWHPEIDAAVARGLSPRTAAQLLDVVGENDALDWLRLAERVGRRELHRAISDARTQRVNRPTLERYRKAIAIADRWAESPEGHAALAAPFAEEDARREGDATSAGGPLRVALPHPKADRLSGAPLRAHPDILRAAIWLLDTVELPRARGFASVKHDNDDRCTNPECGRRSLRTEAHHIDARSLGGSDEKSNGTGACHPDHVRGLHAGRLSCTHVCVEGHDALLWAWPDGGRVLAFRDEPGRPNVQ